MIETTTDTVTAPDPGKLQDPAEPMTMPPEPKAAEVTEEVEAEEAVEEAEYSKASDFLKRTRIEKFTTSSGDVLQIRSIPQLDFTMGFGSHLFVLMGNDIDAFSDDARRAEFLEGLPEREHRRLLESHWEGIKHNVCKSVQTMNLVNKRPIDCEVGETSIEDLADADIYTLWRRVNVISGQPDPGDDTPPVVNAAEMRIAESLKTPPTIASEGATAEGAGV